MTVYRIRLASLGPGIALLARIPLSLASGATVEVYATGTTSPVTVYVGSTGGATLSQPLICDVDGRIPGYIAAQQTVDISINGAPVIETDVLTGRMAFADLADGATWIAEIAALTSGESGETARAEAAEAVLATSIASETTRAEGVEATNATAIATEATARATAVGLLLAKADNLASVASAGTSRFNLHDPTLTPAAVVVTTNVASRSGLGTFDGYTLVAGDHVLLVGQTAASQNGVWVAASGAWTRPATYPSGGSVGGPTGGTRVIDIIQGTLGLGSRWILQTNTAITIDTNVTTWTLQQPANVLTASPSGGPLTWTAATFYLRNVFATNAGTTYICNTTHTSASTFASDASNWTAIGGSGGAVGGDLSGTLPNPTVAAVNGVAVTGTPTSGQIIQASSGSAASWQTLAPGKIRTSHTFAIAGALGVASGSSDLTFFIPPGWISLASGETVQLVKVRYEIGTGTSATISFQRNGSNITGLTSLSATTTVASTTPTAVSLSEDDQLALIVSAVSGSPGNLSFTFHLEHTAGVGSALSTAIAYALSCLAGRR